MAQSAKYDVEAVTVERLLVPESVLLMIPPFQRRYSWGKDEISQLLADLFEDDDWHRTSETDAPYFLGSIVLASDGESYMVLDGQQRLTTISLLLAVLKMELEQHQHPQARNLDKYLVSARFGSKETTKLKLQAEDDSVYQELISNPLQAQQKHLKRNSLVQALHSIRGMISGYIKKLEPLGIAPVNAYEAMVKRVLYYVEFVRIIAPSESEAFKLFETLNDRGLALNAADLIKNKLFAQCGNERIYDAIELWRDIVETVGETEIVHFLRYYWIAFKGDVRKQNLYDVFRCELEHMTPEDAVGFAKDIKLAAEYYRHIIDPVPSACPWGSDTAESLARVVAFRARSCRPVLLAAARFAREHMPEIVKACESITVRHSMVAELNPNQLEKSYGKLCATFREHNGNIAPYVNSALINLFSEVPDDDEFCTRFSQVELNVVTNAWRTILIRLNDFVATGETRIEGPKKVHIEHIFPKNPSNEAYEESGISPEEAENYVGRIGNLTLLSGRKNQKISNSAFSKKRSAFAFSEIALNQDIAEVENWGAEEILHRSNRMAELAKEAWPWPVQLRD